MVLITGLILGFLGTSISAKTVFSAVSVNGVDQGHAVGVRVPTSNNVRHLTNATSFISPVPGLTIRHLLPVQPIKDVASNDIICNAGFIQPVSSAKIAVTAGDQVTAQFHHTSAGYTGPDPSDPLDPTNKGPFLAYLAAIPSATQSDVTGLKWFKIFEDGYDPSTGQWGSDHVFVNKGNITFTIPPCIASGDYLLRVEGIALQAAYVYPGAQFYMSCAQLTIAAKSNAIQTPATVSFPGAYEGTDPGILVDSVFGVSSYTPPGPPVFTC
ncbi:hypothetical protein V5O48_001374 [Marasmius crinis-equi]|uniref:AA9 family lytic polysaccharide monooxygenase n=1 Tax=Marasmius crinis-equi TaxID=585013 RepID=A0ABR3FYL1_9AGAR